MLINILVLVILCVAVFIIVKAEKENLRSWLSYGGQTDLKHEIKLMYLFWREVVRNPIRAVALAVMLVCQRNVCGMLITILIMLGISYYLARTGLLLRVNWKNEENSRMLTYGFVVLGVFWLIDSLSLYNIAVIVAALAVVGGIIYLAAKGELKGFSIKRERASEESDEDDEEDLESEDYEDDDEGDEGDESEEPADEEPEKESSEEPDKAEETEDEPESPKPAPKTRRSRTKVQEK